MLLVVILILCWLYRGDVVLGMIMFLWDVVVEWKMFLGIVFVWVGVECKVVFGIKENLLVWGLDVEIMCVMVYWINDRVELL